MSKKLKIGLFGFGCVGQGLYDIFEANPSFNAEVVKIVVKDRNKPRRLPASAFTFDKEDILNNPDINVVVELINDADEAYEIVKSALQSGKHVVTANKKMLAQHLEELYHLQREKNVSLLYEASACGSIPIIRNLEEYYDNELLNGLSGIFNGSSNYILSKVSRGGTDYATALKEAQEIGFAELDPTLDVEGFDAKFKLCILAAHAFGIFVKPEEVFNFGISTLQSFDLRFAREKGARIKLQCQAVKLGNDQLGLIVMPALVHADHYLYHVEQEYNGVIVEAAFADRQFFSGKGAGGHPTGSAVLSDISALLYDYRYGYRKASLTQRPEFTNDLEIEVYLRYSNPGLPGRLRIQDVSERYSGNGAYYIIGYVPLQALAANRDLLIQENAALLATGKLRLAHVAAPVEDVQVAVV